MKPYLNHPGYVKKNRKTNSAVLGEANGKAGTVIFLLTVP